MTNLQIQKQNIDNFNWNKYFKENMNEYKYYYFNYSLQRYFLKYLFNREFIMLASKVKDIDRRISKRNLRAHNTQSFQFWLYRLRAFESNRLYNLYYSLASYKNGVPYHNAGSNGSLTFNDEKYNETAWKEFIGYDFLLDIDAGDWKDLDFAVETVENIKDFFDEMNFPYFLRFSGRGFHFITDYRFFSELNLNFNPDSNNSIYDLYSKIAEKLYSKFSEMIDFNIYDSRRICKLPFSLSIYNEGAIQSIPVVKLESYKNFYFNLETFINMRVVSYKEVMFNPDGNVKNILNWCNI